MRASTVAPSLVMVNSTCRTRVQRHRKEITARASSSMLSVGWSQSTAIPCPAMGGADYLCGHSRVGKSCSFIRCNLAWFPLTRNRSATRRCARRRCHQATDLGRRCVGRARDSRSGRRNPDFAADVVSFPHARCAFATAISCGQPDQSPVTMTACWRREAQCGGAVVELRTESHRGSSRSTAARRRAVPNAGVVAEPAAVFSEAEFNVQSWRGRELDCRMNGGIENNARRRPGIDDWQVLRLRAAQLGDLLLATT